MFTLTCKCTVCTGAGNEVGVSETASIDSDDGGEGALCYCAVLCVALCTLDCCSSCLCSAVACAVLIHWTPGVAKSSVLTSQVCLYHTSCVASAL
jgi:hypothetical protein